MTLASNIWGQVCCLLDIIFRILLAITQKEVTLMYAMKYVRGHVQVYDLGGRFLFSADSEREAMEELEQFEEYTA